MSSIWNTYTLLHKNYKNEYKKILTKSEEGRKKYKSVKVKSQVLCCFIIKYQREQTL
jgi:hypothetical protein